MMALYRWLLGLLPRAMRAEYGAEMEELLRWQVGRLEGRAARLRFLGGATLDLLRAVLRERTVRGRSRTVGTTRSVTMEALFGDLRTSVRNLARRPMFTFPVVLTLGLGIGLATAMVAVVQGVVLNPLPYPAADRLVVLEERTEEGGLLRASWLNFEDWRAQSSSFEAMSAVYGPRNATVLGVAEPVRVPALFVSADYFRVAGVEPMLGRVLRDEENREGGAPAVVVSHGFWVRSLGSQPDLEGATILVQDLLSRAETYDVVGVMPPGFDLMGEADVLMPLGRGVAWNVRGNHVVQVIGRLRAGVDRAAAMRELGSIQARIHEEFGGETEAVAVGVTALQDDVVGPVRTPVLLLLAGACFLLLTAFLNAGGALLARGVARRQELLIRGALGASRTRLLLQLAMESAVLGLAALVVGVMLARGLLNALARLSPGMLPRMREIDPAWLGLLAAGGALAALGVLVFGVASAAITTRGAAMTSLRVRGGGPQRGARRIWQVLIAAEVALALMLLATSGVLGRSLWRILTSESGFDPRGVITAQVTLPGHRYDSYASYGRYLQEAQEALQSAPGVESVGLTNMLPIPSGSSIGGPVQLEDGSSPDVVLQYRVADEGFFETLDIALTRGRLFDARDVQGAPHAVVINETMAQRLWPGEDPLGRRIFLGGMDPYREDWLTVIGVVQEARPWSVAEGMYPVYYVHPAQRPAFLAFTGFELLVRGRDPAALAESVRTRLSAVDSDVPVRVSTLESRLAQGTADRRFVLTLLGVFGALALLMAAIGIWGVVSFIVSRRTRDLGIRLALGARPAQVLRGLQAETIAPVLLGITVGIALAAALIRMVRSLLFGVDVLDVPSLAAVCVTMLATAWVASWLPARRAKRLDPVVTLRAE